MTNVPSKSSGPRIAVVGDPHGAWDEINGKIVALRPDVAIIVGDMFGEREDKGQDGRRPDASAPPPGRAEKTPIPPVIECLRPALDLGIAIRWIPGNHDSDNEDLYQATFGCASHLLLHERVEEFGCVRVAGLGGIFRGKVWFPHYDDGADFRRSGGRRNEPVGQPGNGPFFETPEQFAASMPKSHRFLGGVPVKHRTTLFPSQFDALSKERADILVTHEAASGYRDTRPRRSARGFREFDDLAAALGAKIAVHGHYHHSYAKRLPNGVLCVGLGIAEVVLVDDLLEVGEREGRLG